MNYITKYELENKELASKFSIENKTLVFDENTEFCDTFQVGFIVAFGFLILGAWYFNKKQDEFILYI